MKTSKKLTSKGQLFSISTQRKKQTETVQGPVTPRQLVLYTTRASREPSGHYLAAFQLQVGAWTSVQDSKQRPGRWQQSRRVIINVKRFTYNDGETAVRSSADYQSNNLLICSWWDNSEHGWLHSGDQVPIQCSLAHYTLAFLSVWNDCTPYDLVVFSISGYAKVLPCRWQHF